MALGWGIDQVVGDGKIIETGEVKKLRGERWKPWPVNLYSMHRLRVPTEGSLENLDEVYESFCEQLDDGMYTPPRPFNQFKVTNYMRAAEFPRRLFACFELPGGTAFRQEAIIEAAAMLRSLTCRQQNRHDFHHQFGDDPAVYLAGHVNGARPTPPRFSYLPLPTIGHDYADGMIRRLMVVEQLGGDGSRANWAQTRLMGQTLLDNKGDHRGQLLELSHSASRRLIRRYAGYSRAWSTVTPVLLPGFDDGKQAKAIKLLRQSVAHSGIEADAISEITIRKAPYWTGSQHPRDYRRPNYLQRYSAWHVHLEFHKPVSGPLAIGAGRHVGLGLFAASSIA